MLFTGVVWTSFYRDLFQKLSQRKIRFSIIVYDIIPIEHPDLVETPHSEAFTGWLETVVTLASIVFVSSEIIKDQILRWAALTNVYVNARIVPIRFGCAIAERAFEENLETSTIVERVDVKSFVLSVGTIDRRKNQLLLCRLWERLVCQMGQENVPQLVLVGRDDLDIANQDEAIASLIDVGKIVVLQGLNDIEVASLYRACSFTVLPSMAEGYGLPVAESLQYGKLCLSSDLPVVREHAGDLPWYFNPGDEAGVYEMLRKAITDHEARASAEARIAKSCNVHSWAATYRSICEAIRERTTERRILYPKVPKLKRVVVPGLATPAHSVALASSQKWCTDRDPQVSIIVINWNAAALTLECVRQIWANTEGVCYEIIIVDNGSRPEQVAPLRSLGHGVRLIELGINRFFGEANNIGAEASTARCICFLNNDAFGRSGWLRSLVNLVDRMPDAGAAGPLLLFPGNIIQEAGAVVNERGFPERFGRGHSVGEVEFLTPKTVDYVSAAALLVMREVFLSVGGFDLAYEPAYYEDADLCFKIRACGKHVYYCPEAQVVHIEGAAANDDLAAISRRQTLGDLNRDKFTARWSAYLQSRAHSDLERIGHKLMLYKAKQLPLCRAETRTGLKTAALYTPFMLTPGGGELYLMTLASVLAEDHAVTIVTQHRYSFLRLLQLSREFSLDLPRCDIITEQEFLAGPPPSVMVTLGNHLIPPIAARSADSVYICQFPFPLSAEEIRAGKQLLTGYRCIAVYSQYVRMHVEAQLSAYQLPSIPVEVVRPPVGPVPGHTKGKKNIILSVGRFFANGHNKRHDILIGAFKNVRERFNGEIELHLAGSSLPIPVDMDYLKKLREMADGLPVVFHVNASRDELFDLYAGAAIYWHGTGLEADLATHPEQAEHFGITIVEAMASECVVLAFNSGGPREFIRHGGDGFLFASVEELQDLTLGLLRGGLKHKRTAIGLAAREKASAFFADKFTRRIREIV